MVAGIRGGSRPATPADDAPGKRGHTAGFARQDRLRHAMTATASPQIWVDADACPVVIKEILFRAAERAQLPLTLVANQWLRTPPSRFIRAIQVLGGLDSADNEIVRRLAAGDLVVTQDIPLASLALEKGAVALNPRGDLYTRDNIAERLSVRNFMDELRGAGIQTGGPPAFHARDRQAFAAQLDRWLARRPR
jgi:uncharacterized protein YaiI (UPF0178 family)